MSDIGKSNKKIHLRKMTFVAGAGEGRESFSFQLLTRVGGLTDSKDIMCGWKGDQMQHAWGGSRDREDPCRTVEDGVCYSG